MTDRVRDPVCGMEFDPERSDFTSEYRGRTYYFCCPVCKRRFDDAPEEYAQRLQRSK